MKKGQMWNKNETIGPRILLYEKQHSSFSKESVINVIKYSVVESF